MKISKLIAAVLALVGIASSRAHADEGQAIEQAVQAMCAKPIVLLGEATHGGGHTTALKAELVQRLVTQCGFNVVLFESSFYEFFPIAEQARERQRISPALVATAVGGVWKFSQEMQALLPFLAQQATDGKIELGGLDFQAGGFQQPYSNGAMFAELSAPLADDRRAFCKALFRARIYDNDDLAGFSSLLPCVSDMAAVARQEQLGKIRNLQAWLATDGRPQADLVRARDRMMAENASAWIDRTGTPAKVLIWTHNGHAARDTARLPDYGDQDNLGRTLSRSYGDKVFALAISAYDGDFRWSKGVNKALPPAPDDSLEARFGRTQDINFVSALDLRHAATIASAVFGYNYLAADWSKAYDGMLILNREYPSHDSRDQPIQPICIESPH